MKRWRREDIEPLDLFRDRQGRLWRVLSIADEPTVTMQTLHPQSMMEHCVISSQDFAEKFPEKLEPRSP